MLLTGGLTPQLITATWPSHRRAPGRVLVVGDTGERRRAVVGALIDEGFDVVATSCGPDTLAAAMSFAPDAVVLDACDLEARSFDLCRSLKATTTSLLPVLHLWDAETAIDDRTRSDETGADGYLVHPFDPNELRSAVSALVRLTRQDADWVADVAINSLLHDALDALADHVALLGPDGDVIAVNSAWTEFALANGYHAGGTGLGANYCEVCDRASGDEADEGKVAAAGIRQVLARTVDSFELDYPCHSAAARRWYRMTVRRVARPGRIAAIVTHADRTREHLAAVAEAAALARVEAERASLAAIFQQAPSFLAVMRGPNYVFERINPAYRQLTGSRDPIGLPLLDALPELRGQGFVELLDHVRATGESFVGKQLPVQLQRVAGAPLETRYVDMVYLRVDSDGGNVVVAHGVDVTEQVLATQALLRTEQRLRDQFAKLPVPTLLWETARTEFVLLDWNEAALRASPHLGSTAVGRTIADVFPGMEAIGDDLRRSLRDNMVVRRNVDLDLGGALGLRSFDLTIGPQQPDRILVHYVDTTERTELEAQLRQAQKMEAVGRLAGGVAHDFNNLLTVISAHSSFLLESLDSSDPQHEDAEAIHKAGIRAAGLTRQLLAFSRKQILKPAVLDLNAIVSETRKMLERLLGEDVEVVTDLAPDLGRVLADASQLDQVLVNLAVNARDAMPTGGRLTLTTRNVTTNDGRPGARRIIPAGDYVLLEVADTGVGMTAAVKARLFEPFFTTKGPGKGTGLGLATAYGIVKQSGGFILVESALDAGTTFQVYLPVASRDRHSGERLAMTSETVGGDETVLIIEDEEAVRGIAASVLSRAGYTVLEAASGAAALALAYTFKPTIDLVVSDAVMPAMSGAEAVDRLRRQRPGLKALFMSGYTDDEMMRAGIVSSAVRFLQKPFEPADLARAVRDALDA